jgi:hypothetical protein
MSKNSFTWENRYKFPAQTKEEAASYLANGIKAFGWTIVYGSNIDSLLLKGAFQEYAFANDIPFNELQIIKDLKQEWNWDYKTHIAPAWESSEICY